MDEVTKRRFLFLGAAVLLTVLGVLFAVFVMPLPAWGGGILALALLILILGALRG